MRELKFRAWDKVKKEWIDDFGYSKFEIIDTHGKYIKEVK